MLLTGAFRTGETARAALYVYPFVLVRLNGLPDGTVRRLACFACLQTAVMQVFGGDFW